MDGVELTDDQVRAARRAYYGAISFVDDQVARLLTVLRETGRLDEHGRHRHQRPRRDARRTRRLVQNVVLRRIGKGAAARLVARGGSRPAGSPRRCRPWTCCPPCRPRQRRPGRSGRWSGAGRPARRPEPAAAPVGQPDRDEAVGEYLAEGAIAPIVMIRRGRHKFIHSPADPDQLFDLAADPGEQVNLAGDPGSADLADAFRREVAARWDLAALDRDGAAKPAAQAGRPRGARHRPPDLLGLRARLRRRSPLYQERQGPRRPRTGSPVPAGGAQQALSTPLPQLADPASTCLTGK